MGMKKENISKLLPVLQAYAAGKKIQLRNGDYWYDLPDDDVTFTFDADDYRVKPELRWRPLTLQEYLDGYACFYAKRLVKRKNNPDIAYAIITVGETGVTIGSSLYVTWEALTSNFTWHDGTEIGIRE